MMIDDRWWDKSSCLCVGRLIKGNGRPPPPASRDPHKPRPSAEYFSTPPPKQCRCREPTSAMVNEANKLALPNHRRGQQRHFFIEMTLQQLHSCHLALSKNICMPPHKHRATEIYTPPKQNPSRRPKTFLLKVARGHYLLFGQLVCWLNWRSVSFFIKHFLLSHDEVKGSIWKAAGKILLHEVAFFLS